MTSKRETRTIGSMRRETDRVLNKGRDVARREPRRSGTRAAIVRTAVREA